MSNAASKQIHERGFSIEHTFRASAAKVFGAYTDPKLVPQWWAPKGATMTVEAMEVRAGGAYRFVQHLPDGTKLVFVGKYLTVDPVHHLSYTFMIEGQGGEVTTTIDLRETPAGTVMTLSNVFASKEARDAAMQYGAVAGAQSAMGALDAFLRRAAQTAGGAAA
jgi:uncharacterized protein YndB with AHSA1/START domain